MLSIYKRLQSYLHCHFLPVELRKLYIDRYIVTSGLRELHAHVCTQDNKSGTSGSVVVSLQIVQLTSKRDMLRYRM